MRRFLLPLLLLAPLAAGQSDVERAIADLAHPEKGRAAMVRLKQLDHDRLAPLERAAQAPLDLRSARARALLAYHAEKGGDRELALAIALAALPVPPGSEPALAAERERGRSILRKAARSGARAALDQMLATYPGDDYERYAACRDALAETRGDAVVDAARTLLGRDSLYARVRAAHLLALIGGERALGALATVESDPAAIVRQRVLKAYVDTGEPRWLARCRAFLTDPDPFARAAAVAGFARSGADDRGPALLAALDDAAFPVRFAAARALESMPRPVAAALDAPDAPDGRVVLLASFASRDRARLEALAARDGRWPVRAAALEGLARLGVTPEVSLRGELHPFVEDRLARALGTPRGVPPADPAKFKETGRGAPRPEGIAGLTFTKAELAGLDDALRALKLGRRDLCLPRVAGEPDRWRLPIVDETLADPLRIQPALERLAGSVRSGTLQACVETALRLQGTPEEEAAAPAAVNAPPGWPQRHGGPLLCTWRRLAAAVDLAEAALDLTPEQRAQVKSAAEATEFDVSTGLLECAARLDLARLLRAARLLGEIEGDWGRAEVRRAFAEAAAPVTIDTDRGRVVVGSRGPDTYRGDALLIVDPGGDDSYDCDAAVILDLGGDDTYRGRVASGVLRVAMLLDFEGDDSYLGGSYTQGAALFGVGLLRDYAGDDTYRGDFFCQGAGAFGLAALVDDAGDDFRTAYAFCQAFAFSGAFGALVDVAGNDLYFMGGRYLQYESMPSRHLNMGQGAAFGFRPHSSGGVALLLDLDGDDHYQGEAYAQGTAYWFGFGACVDLRGADTYSAEIYSLGSGIHYGVGAFADLQGEDNYMSWGLSMSGSHDRGVSTFLEGGGDDQYVVRDAALGGAINDAVAIFVDAGGRDAYLVKNRGGLGSGEWRGRASNSIGMFLDLGGREDTYDSALGGNGRWWTQGFHGVGIDR